MTIRRFIPEDAEEVSALITRTLREVNIKDYTAEYLEKIVQRNRPEDVLERARWTHFYVVCEADRITGCGAIGPYWDREDESSLFTIFVHPEYLGKGIGRTVIETLEQDEFFLRAKRIEVPASLTAIPFYLKNGLSIQKRQQGTGRGTAGPDGKISLSFKIPLRRCSGGGNGEAE